jgi:hypothetical protein
MNKSMKLSEIYREIKESEDSNVIMDIAYDLWPENTFNFQQAKKEVDAVIQAHFNGKTYAQVKHELDNHNSQVKDEPSF